MGGSMKQKTFAIILALSVLAGLQLFAVIKGGMDMDKYPTRVRCMDWPKTRAGYLVPGYGFGCWLLTPLEKK